MVVNALDSPVGVLLRVLLSASFSLPFLGAVLFLSFYSLSVLADVDSSFRHMHPPTSFPTGLPRRSCRRHRHSCHLAPARWQLERGRQLSHGGRIFFLDCF